MTIKPCHNKILVNIIEDNTTGVLLPDQSQNPRASVFVEAVGPEVKCCKPGDQVLLRPNTNMAELSDHITGDSTKTMSILDDTCVFAVLETNPVVFEN